MKYKVKVIETLEKVVEVEAINEHDAFITASDMWRNGDITLISPDNITDCEIYVIND